MTEILDDLLFQLSSESKMTIVFIGKNTAMYHKYDWLNYDFFATTTVWTFDDGISCVNIYLDNIDNVSYDKDENIYNLYLSKDEIVSFVMLD